MILSYQHVNFMLPLIGVTMYLGRSRYYYLPVYTYGTLSRAYSYSPGLSLLGKEVSLELKRGCWGSQGARNYNANIIILLKTHTCSQDYCFSGVRYLDGSTCILSREDVHSRYVRSTTLDILTSSTQKDETDACVVRAGSGVRCSALSVESATIVSHLIYLEQVSEHRKQVLAFYFLSRLYYCTQIIIIGYDSIQYYYLFINPWLGVFLSTVAAVSNFIPETFFHMIDACCTLYSHSITLS